ncbi:TetR/AcrR family transcriptional regulator [Catellatospora sp. NPDC049111]|uniref:TetR/AcrR family transcriptional regulator n=1 Tax=Catellatospora sp. NPDC049111 TaxID=3155271 RepID=UPI0033EA19C7
MPSITRSRSGSTERRRAVEEQILDTASRLLAEGTSFTALGVQHIASQAGIARSTFYLYFADKTELLIRLADSLNATSFDIASTWHPANGLERLAGTFADVVANYRAQSALLAAIHEASAYDRSIREFWNTRLEPFRDNARKLIASEQKANRTPPGIDPDAAARIMVDGGDGFLLRHVGGTDSTADNTAAWQLATTWWYGIFRRPTRPARP